MKETKTVLYPSIARKLIHMGYTIVDLRPKKENFKLTSFVFKVEGNFFEDFDKLMAEHEEKVGRKKEEKEDDKA